MQVYLDCNATAPMEPAVKEAVLRYMTDEYGNAGSRTHEYGNGGKQGVQTARLQVAKALAVEPDDVIFTSGATESDNLAILGLAPFAMQHGRRHIVTTAIEHKAVWNQLSRSAPEGLTSRSLCPSLGDISTLTASGLR